MIKNDKTFSKESIECNVCLNDVKTYTKFCKCNVRTCFECYYKLMYLTDKPLCDCCENKDDDFSLLKIVVKCPLCRSIRNNAFTKTNIDRLKIPSKIIIQKMLEYNYCITRKFVETYEEVNYETDLTDGEEYDSEYESDDDRWNLSYRQELQLNRRELGIPKIERDDIINVMIQLNLRHLFDF